MTRFASLLLSLVLVLVLATTAMAAKSLNTVVGTFTATTHGLELTNDQVKFNIVISHEDDGTWILESSTEEPMAFLVHGDKQDKVSYMYYQPSTEMWTYFSPDFDGERSISKWDATIITPAGMLMFEMNGILIIPDGIDDIPVHISYNGNNNWTVKPQPTMPN